MREFTLTLASGEARVVTTGGGRVLSVKTCDYPITATFNSAEPHTIKAGTVFPYDGEIKNVGLLNPNSSPVTINFFVGSEPINFLANDQTAAIISSLPDAVEAIPATFGATNGGGAASQFKSTQTFYRWAVVIALKDAAGTENTESVFIGIGASSQPIEILPGQTWILPVPTGGKVDFRKWYLSVTVAGDGIQVIYL
ncbi:MAG: hypothetical protein WDM76_09515 [Limisphaerales bacterium]